MNNIYSHKSSLDGFLFDSALELRCYQTVKRAVADLGLAYKIIPHYSVNIKPPTVLYPAIDYKVDLFLCPEQGNFSRLKPWLIEVKSNFTLKKESFALRLKMFECWNKAEYSHLIVMGDEPLTTSLKVPIVQRSNFLEWLARNHRLLG